MTEMFLVHSPGPYTTIQDRGRFGYVHMGVPVSGALDEFAYTCANLLVGNSEDRPALEITFAGPHMKAMDDADIALTGADMDFTINGMAAGQWRTIRVKRGDSIRINTAHTGCRAYLAVTGGISVPEVMGSCSTYVSGKIGGINGRAIRADDVLERKEGKPLDNPRQMTWHPLYGTDIHIRAIPGPQEEYFRNGMDIFFSEPYTVTDKANRMGYRLAGPEVSRNTDAPQSIISEPSIYGNVQIPPDGKPIILMAEQTIGGYAKIATVITPDLFRIAQARPGDRIRFHRVTLAEAHGISTRWLACRKDIRQFLQAEIIS